MPHARARPLRPESGHPLKACVSAALCQSRLNAQQQAASLLDHLLGFGSGFPPPMKPPASQNSEVRRV
jgi:hypothetical protein